MLSFNTLFQIPTSTISDPDLSVKALEESQEASGAPQNTLVKLSEEPQNNASQLQFNTAVQQRSSNEVKQVTFEDKAPSIEKVQKIQPASESQMRTAIQKAIQNSYARVPDLPGENRHELNRRLQVSTGRGTEAGNRALYDGSDVVVIAFEGTGAFDARRPGIMQEAADMLRKQGLQASTELYTHATDGLESQTGIEPVWSGLGKGPLASLVANPDLQSRTQWLSFPSEEFEALSHPEAYKKYGNDPIKLLREMKGSTEGNTPGINNALNTLREIQAQARAQGKNPKIVIVAHSSGGRSTVKFLEKAKALNGPDGKAMNFPFVMTIDPVREAHEAVGEAARELINKGTEHNVNRLRSGANEALNVLWPGARAEFIPQRKVYPPTIGFQKQPESLYKPGNVGDFVSFYQRDDEMGIDHGFGIHGSPVEGASNHCISDCGERGHGNIASKPRVTRTFIDNIRRLMPVQPH